VVCWVLGWCWLLVGVFLAGVGSGCGSGSGPGFGSGDSLPSHTL